MNTLIDLLASTPLLLLFVVIGLGYLVGSIRVAGFSLGPAAVLFTGIFLGSVDPRLRLPDIIYILGLILFVYTIGLQSGAAFFNSFGKRGLQVNLFAFAVLCVGAVLTAVAWKLLSLDGVTLVGVFCGSLTNTPALAASIETIKEVFHASPGSVLQTESNAPVIGYSVSYPFGVIGVLLGFYVYSMRTQRPEHRAGADDDEHSGPILARSYRVTNSEITGKSIPDVIASLGTSGIVFSRLKRGDVVSLVYADTTFQQGDLVVAVASEHNLEKVKRALGQEAREEIQLQKDELDFRRIVASEKNIVGKKIKDLRLQDLLDATITRIRRGDVDFVPSGDTVIEFGDRIRVLTWVGNLDRITRYFGDSVKSSSEADFFSVSLGIVLGVLVGMVPLPLPGGSTFTLGFAAGPLIVGLILGRIQRTRSIVWGMPFSANLTLRQVGMVLFLAGVGTRAGDGFVRTLLAGGWVLAVVGAAITSIVTILTLWGGSRFLKLSPAQAMGMMSGIQTQPACLGYVNDHTTGDAANVWYASVYPVSMVAKIVLAQLLVRVFV